MKNYISSYWNNWIVICVTLFISPLTTGVLHDIVIAVMGAAIARVIRAYIIIIKRVHVSE